MAFIIENGTVISFAEYSDVFARDKRLFDSNEALTDDVVENALIRATERILSRFSSSSWWREYYIKRDSDTPFRTVADIPSMDPNKIIGRENDFIELCVYWALAEYILPQTANFGDEEDDDRSKIGYYQNRYDSLYGELITLGDWYDFDDDLTIQSDEKDPGTYNLRRYR